MGINRVQEAVEAYERTVKKATQDYEDILRKAELTLRAAISNSDVTEPPNQDLVTMERSDYEQLQAQLQKVSEFIKANPGVLN